MGKRWFASGVICRGEAKRYNDNGNGKYRDPSLRSG